MTNDEIRELMATQLGRRSVADGDLLVRDLAAESMDLVGILAAVDDRWGVAVDERELGGVETVGDLIALVQSAGQA